jgi:hypothetical protein
MEDKNLVLKYMDLIYDSEEEMDWELDEMEAMTDVLASLEDTSRRRQAPRRPREVTVRDFVDGHNRIWAHYFAPNPVYGPRKFRRR